jgi:TolB-like protein
LATPSIAVLPFADMSPEHDQQYLGDGIAEELLNALASIEGLNVAARTSSFSFAGKGASIKEIGDTLHVRHVLEGSVRRSGQRLRVTAQLIDVETGFHRYSQSYDREVKDVFDIQNEIAREIITALMPRLGLSKDVALIKQGTSNLEAYNLRLKAHPALMNPAPGTLGPATQQLRQAITLDPQYSDAWGDLSYAYAYMANWATDPVPLLVNATSAAAVALSDSPTNVMGLLTQGAASAIVHHDYVAAGSYFERARAAGGDFSIWAFQKAYIHDGPLGHYDEAIAMLKEAERKDPLAPNLRWALIEMYLASGRVTEAVATAKEFQRLGSRAPGGIMLCGLAYLAAGDLQSARESLGSLRAAVGDEFPVTMILRFAIYGATNDRNGAKQLLDHLLSQDAEGRAVHPYIVGEGYRALGDYDRAIDWWARAADRHYAFALTFMPVRKRNHPIIGRDPRFLALLRRLGLDANPASPAGPR